jgi:Zn-finger nucleic acid-binding protein
MQEETFDARHGRTVTIDICHVCQSLWFDAMESVSLTPGATLTLFRVIGEKVARPRRSNADVAKCPRCRGRLRRAHDMQRTTRFQYLRCPNDHGWLITFFDFLREKDFIRPLTEKQVAELRDNVGTVNCANCGAPVDLRQGRACTHCGSPLSMLDMRQAERLVSQLQQAEDRTGQPVDPALPLLLERARREAERSFAGAENEAVWFGDVASTDLVGAGLSAVARWFRRNP